MKIKYSSIILEQTCQVQFCDFVLSSVYSFKRCRLVNTPSSHACHHVQIGLEYDFHDVRLGSYRLQVVPCLDSRVKGDVDISLYSFVKWSRVVNVPDIHVRVALEYDVNLLGCPWQPRHLHFMRESS